MIIKEMQNLINSSELISIVRDCSSGEIFGIVEFINDEVTIVKEYTSEGQYDGITIFETIQIENFYWGNREHLAIKELIEDTIEVPQFKYKTFQEILIEVNSMYDCIAIYEHHNEDCFDLGEIQTYDQEWLKVLTYGTKKTLSRLHKVMKRESISRIAIDSPYQQHIVKLHQKTVPLG